MQRSPSHRVRGLLHPACGPLVRIELRGPEGVTARGLAVLDTGASMSAIDRDIARALGLPSPRAARWFAVTDTGEQPVSAVRSALVRIADDRRRWALDLVEIPRLSTAVEGYTLVALLGWDFLIRCRLTCDGPAGSFELVLPAGRGAPRSRR